MSILLVMLKLDLYPVPLLQHDHQFQLRRLAKDEPHQDCVEQSADSVRAVQALPRNFTSSQRPLSLGNLQLVALLSVKQIHSRQVYLVYHPVANHTE